MKILFLGDIFSPLIPLLKEEDDVFCTDLSITPEMAKDYDFLISYGYRHILKKEILDLFLNKSGMVTRAINLHISFLPWNRGADPNLWSFVQETPKGVTIHYLDEGIDTGDIIIRKEVKMYPDDTLATSYNRLQEEIMTLFEQEWSSIKIGACDRFKQRAIYGSSGSYHNSKDKEKIRLLFQEKGFDTPVAQLYIY